MRDLSRALGYCRVSTQRQNTEGHGLERYIDRLKQYGLTDEQIHWDIESGASEKRKGYNRVLELVRSHQIDQIIVPCFDRFTRSALGWEVARQELQEFGVELLFLDGGGLDLETPEGLFTSRILAAMSAQVRDKNRYNSIQGHRYFQEKRKIYRAVFGFVKEGDSVKPNRAEYRNSGKSYADVAIECVSMFIETGELARTIRRMIDKYGVVRLGNSSWEDFPRDISKFRKWLEHPQLCGMVRYYPDDASKTLILESNHEKIISVEQHNQIKNLLSKHPRARRIYPNNPLVGIAFCGVCGAKMEKVSNTYGGKRYEHLRCTAAYPPPRKTQSCQSRIYFKLTDAVAACIKKLRERAEAIANNIPSVHIQDIPPEIIELQQQILTLKRLDDPDLQSVILNKEQRLESLIKSSQLNVVADEMRGRVLRGLASNKEFWDAASPAELTAIFHELVESLTCLELDGVRVFSAQLKI
ncbi:resolvase domain-containing protein [Calothrix sp. NIES-4101]|nr:resolvase domain-containing protein [Calothrix sp. NIES-4101]